MIKENISLKKFNTFGIEANASFFLELNKIEDTEYLKSLHLNQFEKYIILGEGSNMLLSGDYEGLIIFSNTKGKKIIEDTQNSVTIEFSAGENWHEAVRYCVDNNYCGLENLALIPGTLGAAPVQNIGAYGVEQCEYFTYLTGINLLTGEELRLNRDECRFGYRDSIFKHELKNKFLITSVCYTLPKNKPAKIEYPDLIREFELLEINNPSAKDVFEAVSKIRKRKLPYPDEAGNAGSFFKNPVVSLGKFNELKTLFPEIRGFQNSDGIKLSAAWLIESCGWKAKKLSESSDAAVSHKHSLVLVNLGSATGNEIIELAGKIISSVNEKFGVKLEPEVNII